MTAAALYDLAEQDHIDIFAYDVRCCDSFSILQDGECTIIMNPFRLDSAADEKVKLAHELGHCETGAFYNEYAACDIRGYHENRANRWAIKKLVPEDELKQAFKSGCRNRFELSEYFGVTEDFMQLVMDYYISSRNY